MSHEAKTERQIYRNIYGLPFEASNPGEDGGVEWLNHYMQVDATAAHPFLPEQQGNTWMFIVVEDDKYPFPESATPDALHDSDLARFQFKHWRNRAPKLTEAGLVEYGPMKLNDDFGNGLMMLFHDHIVRAAPLTAEERREVLMPDSARLATLQELPPAEQGRAFASRDFLLARLRAAEAKEAGPRATPFVNKFSFMKKR